MNQTNNAITIRLQVDKAQAASILKQFGAEVAGSGKTAEKGMSGLGDEIEQSITRGRKEVERFEETAKKAGDSSGKAMSEFGDKAEKATGKAASGATRFKKVVDKIGITGLVGSLVGFTGAGAMLSVLAGSMEEYDDAMARAKVSTGANADELERFGNVTENLWDKGIGQSIGEVAEAVVLASKKMKTANEDSLVLAAGSALSIQRVFGDDTSKVISAAAELVKKFGLTYEESFDFITEGYQRGLDASGDFLDSILEYSVQFSNAEADAGQFFSVLETGLQGGVLGTDKAADMFKEFSIRIVDGSKTTQEALGQLGINAQAFVRQITDGNITRAEAFDIITKKLAGLDSQVIQSQAGAGLLGTQFEDLGNKAALGVDTARTKISDLKGAASGLEDQYNTLGKEIDRAMRHLRTSMVNVVRGTNDGTGAVSTLSGEIVNLADTIEWNRDDILNLFTGIVRTAGTAGSAILQVTRSAKLLGVVAASEDKSLWDWLSLSPEGARQWQQEIEDGTAFLKDELANVRLKIKSYETAEQNDFLGLSRFFGSDNDKVLEALRQKESQIIGAINRIKTEAQNANVDEALDKFFYAIDNYQRPVPKAGGSAGGDIEAAGGERVKQGGWNLSEADKTSSDLADAYQKAYASMDTINQKTYDAMLDRYTADYEAFVKLTGDKETALAIYSQRVSELNDKMYGADTYNLDSGSLSDGLEKNQKIIETFEEAHRRATMTTTEFQLAELRKQYDYYAQHIEDKTKLDEWYASESERIAEESASEWKDAFDGWATSYSSTLNEMLWGSDLTFENIATSFGKMVTQMIIQQQMLKAMEWVGDIDWGGIWSSMAGAATANAHGNVYAGPGIAAYENQIVSNPTLFPFAKGIGLMGEDGHEAIMPLTRASDGDLGVKVVGGGGITIMQTNYVTVESSGNSSDSSRDQEMGEMVSEAIEIKTRAIIEDELRHGGLLNRSKSDGFI